MNLLEIKDPSFIKNLSISELISLASDVRSFIIDNVSKNGGHLSSNLGVVEIIEAMHYVFTSPVDKFLFDVGHQCYAHKILTGRADKFVNLRSKDGVSGFINKDESIHDIFESGHSSTSLSAQCGYLLSNCEGRIVSLIGDASIANGVALEALNYMITLEDKAPIIIINDNDMSISKNVGAFNEYLNKLKNKEINNNLFEELGYVYLGPYDGNDIKECINALNKAKDLNKACIVHFYTKKGKGYLKAENDQRGYYHAINRFDVNNGSIIDLEKEKLTYAQVASLHIEKMLGKEEHFIITPAMATACYLLDLINKYPRNVIDVGIAEEHAAVMASTLALNNKKVILMYYSTFAQRAYDYIVNDIARLNAPVTICLDRCDLVSGDGHTHQGIYDLAMFNPLQQVSIASACDGDELCALLDYGDNLKQPFVIRYFKEKTTYSGNIEKISKPNWVKVKDGKDLTIVTYGNNVSYILNLVKNLDISVEVINARFIKPFDQEMLNDILKDNKPLIVYENVVETSSLGSEIMLHAYKNKFFEKKIHTMSLPREINIPSMDKEEIRVLFNLDEKSILKIMHLLLDK